MYVIKIKYHLLKVAAVLLPLVFCSMLQGQQYIPNWHLAHVQLDFSAQPLTVTNNTAKSDIYRLGITHTTNGLIYYRGITKAQISTPSYNHSFYCNGVYAFDNNFDTLNNKQPLGVLISNTSLTTTTVNDNSLFLTTPDSNIYILVNVLNDSNIVYGYNEPSHFNISLFKIDTRLRGGKGDIYSQELLLSDTLDWKGIHAVRHANGRDWWLVVHRINDNKYYKILYSDHIERIDTQAISYHSAIDYEAYEDRIFSPSGSLYANTMQQQGLVYNDTVWKIEDVYTELFSFDRCTGLFTEKKKIHTPIDTTNGKSLSLLKPNGVAFSPNERFLYITQNRKLYQYDIALDSLTFIVEYKDLDDSFFVLYPNNYYKPYSISLAPNGRIYFTLHYGTLHPPRYIAAIEYPDRAGLACGFNPFSIDTHSDSVFGGFPNTANYELGAIPSADNHRLYYDTICEGDSYSRAIDSFPNTRYHWYAASQLLSEGLSYTASPTNSAIYTIHIQDTLSSCSDRWDTVLLYVINCDTIPTDTPFTFSMPTAFSPNGDGKNEVFYPVMNKAVIPTRFAIYNRWNELVYSYKNDTGWDGKYNGTTQPDGVYYYIIEINGEVKRGVVTVVR